MQNHQEKTTANSEAQRTYKAPDLQEYGNIRALTTAGSSGQREDHPVFTGPRP